MDSGSDCEVEIEYDSSEEALDETIKRWQNIQKYAQRYLHLVKSDALTQKRLKELKELISKKEKESDELVKEIEKMKKEKEQLMNSICASSSEDEIAANQEVENEVPTEKVAEDSKVEAGIGMNVGGLETDV